MGGGERAPYAPLAAPLGVIYGRCIKPRVSSVNMCQIDELGGTNSSVMISLLLGEIYLKSKES